MVLPNLYGDIVSDLAAGLVGGLGVAPGANIGTEWRRLRAGPRVRAEVRRPEQANPTAVNLTAALMLQHIGEPDAADACSRRCAMCWPRART